MWFTHVKFQKHMWISYPMCFTWDYFHMWNTCAINMCFTCEEPHVKFPCDCFSHVKIHMWNFTWEISHVNFHMWNFTYGISHVKIHMWIFACEWSYVRFHMWSLSFNRGNFTCVCISHYLLNFICEILYTIFYMEISTCVIHWHYQTRSYLHSAKFMRRFLSNNVYYNLRYSIFI